MTLRELEKLVLADGWRHKGKVTIPNHTGDISKAVVQSVLKQTGFEIAPANPIEGED